MAVVRRNFKLENPIEHSFVKNNVEPHKLLSTIQSHVGSQLVYDTQMVIQGNGVGFVVLVDTSTENMDEYVNNCQPILRKIATFIENQFQN